MEIAVNVPLMGTNTTKTLSAFKKRGVIILAFKAFQSPVTGQMFFAGVGQYDGRDGVHGVMRQTAGDLGVGFITLSKNGGQPRMFFSSIDHDDDGEFPAYFERVESVAT